MMKRVFVLISILIFLLITACSKGEEEVELEPTDYLHTFIEHWENHEFEEMPNLISEESITEHGSKEIVERYEKIYTDLDIKNVTVSFDEPPEEEIEQAWEEGSITIPIHVSMDSIADEISFRYDVELQKIETDAHLENEGNHTETFWKINWDPGFIFPPLREGGEVAIRTTEPERGEILDRNKMPLAINDIVYEIGVVTEGLEENRDGQLQQIADALHMSVEQIENEISADWVQPDLFVPLKNVQTSDEETLAKLREIPAIRSKEVTGRVYPLGKAAAHLTGYIGQITAEELENLEEDEKNEYTANDMIGKRGLEQLYEKRLKGKRGVRIVIVNDGKEIELAEKPAEDGETISLTIDVNIQKEVFESFDGEGGTSTVIDPQTGETLALVSSPSFDPNEFLYGITQSRWDELSEDPKTPLINRFTATFAPGSVIKPITASIGLAKELIDPDDAIEIEGLTWAKDNWKDFKVRRVSESSKPVDLADALIRSDNIYFAQKAIEMGAEEFIDGLKEFGFEDDLPFAYPLVPSSISTDGTLANEVEVANTSYGQAQIEMSALHLAIAYTPIINEGNMLKPILETTEDSGEIWKENIISKDDAEFLDETLRKVVTEGTGQIADDEDFAISGKTGTAELKLSQDDQDGAINGWFIGYPTEEKDLLIAMMKEDVEGSSEVVETVAELLKTIQKSYK